MWAAHGLKPHLVKTFKLSNDKRFAEKLVEWSASTWIRRTRPWCCAWTKSPRSRILDNYATHKHPNVKAWLEKHPRFHLHFTPTSSSWLKMVVR